MQWQNITFLFITFVSIATALVCWECVNQPNNKACLRNGRPRKCQSNERSCQNEIRKGTYGMLITKRCKQMQACKNDLSSLRVAWWPAGVRCNTRARDAVCRCCCNRNHCNKRTIGCRRRIRRPKTIPPPVRRKTKPKTTTVTTTITTRSASTSTTTIPPTTRPVTTSIPTTIVTATFLTNVTELVEVTTFPNHIKFPTTVQMNPTRQKLKPTCEDPGVPIFGNKSCYPPPNSKGRYEVETECEFACQNGFIYDGAMSSLCVRIGSTEVANFDHPPPVCQRCEALPPLKNGEISCTSTSNPTCYFECDKGYSVFPADATRTKCRDDATWTRSNPCCLRHCPPDIYVDIIILLDSSSPLIEEEWEIMKGFVKTLIESFNVGKNTARFAIASYSDVVDTEAAIQLKDFPDDKERLLEALDEMPFSASDRSDTGLALEYAQNELLRTSNGDRRAANVILVITHSEAYDDETVYLASLSLRAERIFSLAVGIVPKPPDQLNLDQLNQIAGSQENAFIAEKGFQGLDKGLTESIADRICSIRSCATEGNFVPFNSNFSRDKLDPK